MARDEPAPELGRCARRRLERAKRNEARKAAKREAQPARAPARRPLCATERAEFTPDERAWLEARRGEAGDDGAGARPTLDELLSSIDGMIENARSDWGSGRAPREWADAAPAEGRDAPARSRSQPARAQTLEGEGAATQQPPIDTTATGDDSGARTSRVPRRVSMPARVDDAAAPTKPKRRDSSLL